MFFRDLNEGLAVVLQTPHRFGVPALFLLRELDLSVARLPYQLSASKIVDHLHKLLAIINELMLLLLDSLQVGVLAAAQSCSYFPLFRAFLRCGVSRACAPHPSEVFLFVFQQSPLLLGSLVRKN